MNLTPATPSLLNAAKRLGAEAGALKFAAPVEWVYNPLDYAWSAHALYLERFGGTPKRVIFLGMNPGPFGMVQTGVPFGEVAAVRDWLGIRLQVSQPPSAHPRRPILGFDCPRSEVSGKRLWGLFAARYASAEEFFRNHLVVNYCPLAFVEESGRNRTPDKLPFAEKKQLFEICDHHLRAVVEAAQPEWAIGVGDFATGRLAQVFTGTNLKIGAILHPSPANPSANRGWAEIATAQLKALGIW